MQTMMIIAIVNAIVWSGLVTFLLFRMMTQQQGIESQLDRIERQFADADSTQH